MASVSGYKKLKSEISSDSESDYLDIFDENSDDSDNESFSTINSESEDELDNLNGARKWIKLSSVPENILPAPPRFPFTGTPGMSSNIVCANPSTLDFFELFFDQELIKIIVEETNRKSVQCLNTTTLKKNSRVHRWKETDSKEMMVFFGLLLLQGIVQKPEMKWYWSRTRLIETPFFSQVMSESRFSLLMKFLHFSNNNDVSSNIPNPKLKKIWTVFDYLRKKFSSVYTPMRDICIDESLLLYKGRLSWIQYMPLKRSRFGIKCFELCESSTGYVWNIIIYTGKDTDYNILPDDYAMGTKVVLSLSEQLLNKGYCITVDNFYTSPELADMLIKQRTDIYGTVKPTRKDLPPEFKSTKLRKTETVAFQRGKIMVMRWKDKKDVSLLSSIHNNAMVDIQTRKGCVQKPTIVQDYNNTMGGVDRMDKMLSNYPVTRNRQRYYVKLFRHLLDLSVFNAYILYKKHGGKLDHLAFRLDLIDNIVEKYHIPSPRHSGGRTSIQGDPIRLTERHFPEYIPETANQKEPRRRCAVCCRKSVNGKKVRKETRLWCKDCEVGLCISPCFKIYHTLRNF